MGMRVGVLGARPHFEHCIPRATSHQQLSSLGSGPGLTWLLLSPDLPGNPEQDWKTPLIVRAMSPHQPTPSFKNSLCTEKKNKLKIATYENGICQLPDEEEVLNCSKVGAAEEEWIWHFQVGEKM